MRDDSLTIKGKDCLLYLSNMQTGSVTIFIITLAMPDTIDIL